MFNTTRFTCWLKLYGSGASSVICGSLRLIYHLQTTKMPISSLEKFLADYAYSTIVNNSTKPEIDLFASRNNNKCIKYVSWIKDPDAIACDAFTLNWSDLNFYAFPPFALILRVLQKILSEKAEGIVVVPNWPSQPWFPLLQRLTVGEPLHFKADPNLLYSPFSSERHPLAGNLSLIALKLSAKPCNYKTSRNVQLIL